MSQVVRRVELGSPAALPQRTRLSLADGIPFNEWREIGEQLAVMADSSTWWLADWAAYGDRRFRKDYWPALQQMRPGGYAWQTLKDLASVAGRFEPSRRRDGLSFSHHREVAGLPVDEQDAWLDDAEAHDWSVRELRDEIARVRDGDVGPRPAALSVRATGEVVARFEARAAALGVAARELALDVLELASQLDDPVGALEAAGARRAIEAAA